MSDRHFHGLQTNFAFPVMCEHCGRPMRLLSGARYGSNACRQAAYRQRLGRVGKPINRRGYDGLGDSQKPKRHDFSDPSSSTKAAELSQKEKIRKRNRRVMKGGIR